MQDRTYPRWMAAVREKLKQKTSIEAKLRAVSKAVSKAKETRWSEVEDYWRDTRLARKVATAYLNR